MPTKKMASGQLIERSITGGQRLNQQQRGNPALSSDCLSRINASRRPLCCKQQ